MSQRAKLWPLVVALGLLLAGTVAAEVVASNSKGRVLTWEISGYEGAVAGDEEGGGESDEAWFLSAPRNQEHAAARTFARRGDYDEAIAAFAKVIAAFSEDAKLWAEYGHWLRRADHQGDAKEALDRALELSPEAASVHLDLALLARRGGNRAEALREFEEALRLRPMHTSTRIAYGGLLRERGRHAEAVEVLKPATETGSNDRRARALAALGRAYAASGEGDAARKAFSQAVERAPAQASLWARAALEISRLPDEGAIGEGLSYAQQAAKLAPDSAYTQDVLGRSYELAKLEPEAFDAYQRAVKLDGGLRHARQRLVRMAIEREDWSTARRNAQSLLAANTTRPASHFLLGLVEFKAGRYPEARAHYGDAIAASKEPYAEAWYNLGLLERKVGKRDEAISHYQRAIELRPRYLAATNNLGLVYSDLKRYEEAEVYFRRALEIKPSYGSAWINLARSQAKRGLYKEAAESYARALEIDPDQRTTRLQRAVSLRRAGQVEAAIDAYQALLLAEPRYVKAWYNLGIALVAEERFDEAIAAYEEALSLDQDHWGARKNLGLLHLRLGQDAAALLQLSEALERKPADSELRLSLARLAAARGDSAACRAHVDAALSQDSSDAKAREFREECAERRDED